MPSQCRECGGEIPRGAAFCPHCGRQVALGDRGESESGQEKKQRLRAELKARGEAEESLPPQGRRIEAKTSPHVAQTRSWAWLTWVLLGVAIAVAVASLSYSIADHIETEKHVTQLEDIVIGDTSKPVGQGGGLIDQSALAATGIAAVKTIADGAAEDASSASFRVDGLSSKVELLFTGLCEHLAAHNKYGATPIYSILDESPCKPYLE